MRAQALKNWTEDEYLALSRTDAPRHEYVDGEVFAMTGASRRHSLICMNLSVAIAPGARAKGCETHQQNMQLRLRAIKQLKYYYPDLVLTCDRSEDDEYTLNRPCVVIEVLSPTTAATDHREKKRAYLSLPTLRQYVLIDSELQHVESLRRNGDQWVEELLSPEDLLQVECADIALSFDDIYGGTEVRAE